MSCRCYTLYICLLVVFATTESFAPLPKTKTPLSSTCLQLRQNQGSQLVAAWNAAHAHEEDEYHPVLRQEEKKTASSAARAFVSRVFSIPSSMIRRHPFPREEGLEEETLYYPIVGFVFGATDDSHSMAVPTSNCHASLMLHPECEEEPVFGWFSSVIGKMLF